MTKYNDSKITILAINNMLSETPISLKQIQDRLFEDYNITAERKTIYRDIWAITLFRNIQMKKQSRTTVYYDAGEVA